MAKRVRLFCVRPTMGQGGADRVTLRLLKCLDPRVFDTTLVLMRMEGEHIEDIPEDIRVIGIGARSVGTMLWPVARLLRMANPDVILSTSSGTNALVCLAHLLARQRGRIVLSERNVLFHEEQSVKRLVAYALKWLTYRHADAITAVSGGLRDELIRMLRVEPGRVHVVFNPVVDDDLMNLAAAPLEHPWFNGAHRTILGVGRLVRQKDFGTLLRAFAIVRASQPAKLVILGEGPLRPELERMAVGLKVRADVDFPGFDKNPFRYMKRCSVFVQTPIHEGLPNVLVQAMACGAPVISTDCAHGPAEIIRQPGEDGILVPVGDVEQVAKCIAFLLDRPSERNRMGRLGRVSADRFRVEAIIPRYLAAINGAVVANGQGTKLGEEASLKNRQGEPRLGERFSS